MCGSAVYLTSGEPFNDLIYDINDICCLINAISGRFIERKRGHLR